MKITVITGSPHKNGTSSLLADEFIRGATESGHTIFRFDSAFEDVKPCLGCDKCRKSGACVRKDAMEKLYPELIEANAIVFVMPVYYFGMPAQIKTVIDRFYFPESKMKGGRKTALLATAYSPHNEIMTSLVAQYQQVADWMGWANAGMVLATGCGARDDIEHSQFPEQAFALGKRM